MKKNIQFYAEKYNAYNESDPVKDIPPDLAKFIELNANSKNHCVGKVSFAEKMLSDGMFYSSVLEKGHNYIKVSTKDTLFYCGKHNVLFSSCVIEIYCRDCCEVYCKNSFYVLIIGQEKLFSALANNKSVYDKIYKQTILCPEIFLPVSVETAVISFRKKITHRLRPRQINVMPFADDIGFSSAILESEMLSSDDITGNVCRLHGLRVDINCHNCIEDISGIIDMSQLADI